MDDAEARCPCGCGLVVPAGVAEREHGVRTDAEKSMDGSRARTSRPTAILLLSGAVGAGKSTVARIVARRFALGVHLDLDVILHHFVVSGLAPDDPAQIRLGLRNAGAMAANFHDDGFAVVMEGAVPDLPSLGILRTAVAPSPLTVIILAPPLAVSVERDRSRGGKSVADLYRHLDEQMRAELAEGGTWLDTAELTPTQTADQVLTLFAG